MRSVSLVLFALALLLPAFALAEVMTANDIRSDIIGRTMYVATPLGGELPLNYHTSGQLEGTGRALGFAAFGKPTDTGKWWIKDNKLCQQFQTWYQGNTNCYSLERAGEDRVRWTRDNGQKGTARIGD
ncbi:hypothetical protein [Rhizobium sp. BK376]|jgi:hypothetical protein|uniref:hypothetical protein n=1 Tax=Rhizobium sp. BK376 TaxID=2512149 RepID=UPI001045022F|nr:hypothetical protein [Rhizobium sp. BK376]TCR90939.1 hypothetical protein EV561_103333 [Rhizobium sp. BK376]